MMKELLKGFLLALFGLTLSVGTAYGWAWGTHAFVVKNLGLDRLPAESNEIYGSVAADTFNFLFDYPQLMEILATATHTDAEAVWALADNQPEREFAYGFTSHNEMWGADLTAHQYGLTFGGDYGKGYVIAKADILLAGGLGAAFADLGLPTEGAELMAHILVENSIDLLLAQQHPELGEELSRAALFRNQLFPKLLVQAYGDLAPGALIFSVEEGFRVNIIAYGQMLQQSPAVAQQLMATILVEQGKAYLSMFPEVPVPDDTILQNLAMLGLTAGMALCADDFMAELAATIEYVALQLESRGVYD